MTLETQIQSIFVSFIYGMFSSLIYNFIYQVLYCNNNLLKIITNLLYSLIVFSLFFYLLYLINYGSVHIYFVLLFILGFIIGNKKTKKIRFVFKKRS